MKRFLKKRWHHLPIGIITAVLVACLLAGGAFAAYPFWTGSAEVTVDECMSVANLDGGDDGDFDPSSGIWTVSMYPGESKILYVQVSNASSASIDVNLSAVEGYPDIDASWSPVSPQAIPGGTSKNFTLTVTATADATPDTYPVSLSITRG